MFSMTRPFTDSQRQHLRRMLDAIYADFAVRVGEARSLSRAEMAAVARGRVWAGEDAQRVGLVDGLGGSAEALQLARHTIGLPPDTGTEQVGFTHLLPSSAPVLGPLHTAATGAQPCPRPDTNGVCECEN